MRQHKTSITADPNLWGPSVNLQTDFIPMPKFCNFDCVLVNFAMFSAWQEACKHAEDS